MSGPTDASHVRRVIVGTDAQGRSAVVADDVSHARTVRPNGAVSTEIWRQEQVPASAGDDGTRNGDIAPMPPANGVSYRVFTLPPHTPAETVDDLESVRAVFGASNVGLSADGVVVHRSDCLYVATVVSGQAHLVLETGETLLRQGDCFVLPAPMHTWRNPFEETAIMVCAVFTQAPKP